MSFLQAPTQQKSNAKVRAQVALAPGHGLMDWIRKMNNTPNISGTNGKFLSVTEEELSKHNTKQDCWTAIAGNVYNITPYLDFHPGGVDELMRAAGIDATNLFQEIHSWVNFASMLEKCLVGRLVGTSTGATIKPPVTRLRFHSSLMDKKFLRLFIGTNSLNLTTEQVFLHLDQSKNLTGFIYLDGYIHTIAIDLLEKVEENFDVQISTTDKTQFEIILRKKVEEPWRTIGKFRENHLSFDLVLEAIYFSATLIERSKVTHDTDWYTFSIPSNVYLRPQTGFHVRLKSSTNQIEIVKPYTVVKKLLVEEENQNERTIQLMIKHYPDGTMTPLLKQIQIGQNIEMSAPEGNFDSTRIHYSQTIILIAAGTGLTPMISVLNNLFDSPINSRDKKMILLFFNKTQDDILCRQQLEHFEKNYRVVVHHILSKADNQWQGETGHISADLLQRLLPQGIEKKNLKTTLVCVCGPKQFTKLAVELLNERGFTNESLHIFAG